MQNIVITGASGLIATGLTRKLLNEGRYKIYAVTSNPEKLQECYKAIDNIVCCSLKELKNFTKGVSILAVVHCAFSRKNDGREIASSLEYLRDLIKIVKDVKLDAFINISSQSVYGQKEKPLWTEKTPVNPNHLYALGKYASEVIVESVYQDTMVNFTNIRLASVANNARFLNIFIENAIESSPIKVMGGMQITSFIDVRDVTEAFFSIIINANKFKFADVYNLGTGTTKTILEIAEDVQRVYKEKFNKNIAIIQESNNIKLEVGMDNSLFCRTFDWQAKYGFDDTIECLSNLKGMNSL